MPVAKTSRQRGRLDASRSMFLFEIVHDRPSVAFVPSRSDVNGSSPLGRFLELAVPGNVYPSERGILADDNTAPRRHRYRSLTPSHSSSIVPENAGLFQCCGRGFADFCSLSAQSWAIVKVRSSVHMDAEEQGIDVVEVIAMVSFFHESQHCTGNRWAARCL